MFPIETTSLRPRPWPAFLVIVIGIVMFFIPQHKNEQMAIYVGIGMIVFAGVLWLLITKAGITIDDSGLTYKTVFTTKEIFWDNVSRSYIKYERHGKSGNNYWYFENSIGKKVKFSTGLYSRKSLRAIAEAVTLKCKNADIEKKIYNMAEGQFPWYIW